MSVGDGGSSVLDDVNSSRSSQAAECCRQRATRRLVRSAVRDRDVPTLRRLFADVDINDVVNAALSDAGSCSALAYAVRCGYLDVVETLIDMPGCRVDSVDRTKRSALDEAIGAWASAALDSGQRGQHDCGKRHRIVRRILAAGARSLSRPALEVVLPSAMDSVTGRQFARKLVKVKLNKTFTLTTLHGLLFCAIARLFHIVDFYCRELNKHRSTSLLCSAAMTRG